MILKILETGPLMVNTYIVGDEQTKDAAVIDPGGDVDHILAVLAESGLKCTLIVNTHAHFDHTGGNEELKSATGAQLVTHPAEAKALTGGESTARLFGFEIPTSPAPDKLVRGGDKLDIGKVSGRVIELHGHSPCGIGLIFDDEKIAIVGDSLFAGSIGRTDLPGGSTNALLADIRTHLFSLPDDMMIYSGHGPATTVGREKRFNPFF